MPRLACLAVPLFPLAARLRSEPELRHEAVAVVEGQGGRRGSPPPAAAPARAGCGAA
ncbi:MAG: hypothetical protein M5U13_07500 [Thermoanaerobaculia bacterium]|nr:hypothetical protein [Thermoanaerobaculia bacterium]